MANLPDINTADVGIIAFWCAEDFRTAGVVDPSDCTGVFDSYDVYDNGLEGVIALGSGRNFNCRVKNDGWCVAWINRTNTFGHPNKAPGDFGESGYKGYYDILWNWTLYTTNISSTLTTLSYIISLFEAALETSGDFTFAAGDVGHYCYEFPDANVITMMGVRTYVLYREGTSRSKTGSIQYTTGTNLYYAAAVAANYGKHHTQGYSFARFEGHTLTQETSDVIFNYKASADLKTEGWMPNPLTNYDALIYAAADTTIWGWEQEVSEAVLILWS